MDSRKLWAVIFIVVGVAMSQASGPLAAYLTSINALYLAAAAHFMAALGVIPIVIGLYRLGTQGKGASPTNSFKPNSLRVSA